MKRREFVLGSVGALGALAAEVGRGATTPCPVPLVRVEGESSASTPCVAPGTSAMANVAAALVPGEAVTFSQAPASFTRSDFAWQCKFFFDRVRGRVCLFGKQANNNNGWDFAYYTLATNSWTTVWSDEALGIPGHIYGAAAMDPATGDCYLQTHTDAFIRRFTGATARFDFTTSNSTYTLANNGTVTNGLAWHPNLFGVGDGGLVWAPRTHDILFWRKSTNIWGTPYGVGTFTQDYGQAVYVAPLDAVFNYKQTIGHRIAAGPTVSVIPDPPTRVRTSDILAPPLSVLLNHPNDPSRMLILENPVNGNTRVWESSNGTSWSQRGTHPFGLNGGQGYVLCSLTGLNAIWRLDKEASILWRPNG